MTMTVIAASGPVERSFLAVSVSRWQAVAASGWPHGVTALSVNSNRDLSDVC